MRNTLLNQPNVSAQEGSSSAAMQQRCLSTASTTSAERTSNANGEKEKPRTHCCHRYRKCFPRPNLATRLCEERLHWRSAAKFFQSLKNYGKFTGLYWLMSPEPQIQATPLPVATIDDIIFSEEFLQLQGLEAQRQHLLQRAALDWETIQQVSHFTAGQRDNPSWQMIRKSRLTAINFGSILNAKRVTPSLIKRLLGEYDLTRVKAVQWGITNEPEALNSFIQKTGL